MRVVIRTDSSNSIGFGHVIRCLTLADALSSLGATIEFVARAHHGNLNKHIESRGYKVHSLSVIAEFDLQTSLKGYEKWLGVKQEVDAVETIKALAGGKIDWLIVDHYALDQTWEEIVGLNAVHTLVIDDIANRYHKCNCLLDQNYENKNRYLKWVNKECALLLGPSFALLRPEYALFRKNSRKKTISRVMVFFGGVDLDDLTGEALRALSLPDLDNLDVDIVVSANYERREILDELAMARGRVVIHDSLPHLAELMSIADIAIGAGGVANWERMCLGLPGLVVTVANNQIPISKELHEKGAIRWLGSKKDVNSEVIRDALLSEINSPYYAERINTAYSLCDGKGVKRVVKTLLSIMET
jgi:UDP-2,4-diacetamido-2,4,6-trideoxy-beta-L-altropyranose hydrolase